jgi:hypothetical protein
MSFILLSQAGTNAYRLKSSIARTVPYVAAMAVVAVPFTAYAISILHSFYGIGSSFHDAGWSAYLIHDADLQIHLPPCVDGGMSWFNSHISPLFLVTSALGRLVPLTRIQFYAAYIGISHALPAIAVFWLLVSGYRMTRPVPCLLAAVLALLFAFNGLALAIARFPHFAMFIVGAGMMFLIALTLRRVALGSLFFVLCLGTREDAGFHLFALLSMLFVLQWRQSVPWREQKAIAVFAVLALLYSTGVIIVQHALSGGKYSLLVSEYLGYPFFSQVNISSISQRLLGWLAFRGYVVIPAIGTVIWAIARRNAYIVLGYVAFVPWGLLHLTAVREMVGTLPSYYAFPYMFASLWPLIVILIQQRHAGAVRSTFEPLCGFALLTVASFAGSQQLHNPTHMALRMGFVSPPSLVRQAAMDRALERLARAQELGKTLVDQSVLALVPESYHAENILTGEVHLDPESIIFFAGGFESALARVIAARAGLVHEYEVAETPFRVVTNRSLQGMDELTGVLRLQ